MSGKIFAIGDIHGCHQKLSTLLERLPFDSSVDTLIFLGDYIDRGPDSRKVLETLLHLEQNCAHTVFLKGNHEDALLEFARIGDLEDISILRTMGAEATAASYGAPLRRLHDLSCLPVRHTRFLRNLKFAHTQGGYLFVHADISESFTPGGGTDADCPVADRRTGEAAMLASRRLGREKRCFTDHVVVFGHLPFAMPLVKPDRIGIDTGAVFGNMLTAVELPTLRFYHA